MAWCGRQASGSDTPLSSPPSSICRRQTPFLFGRDSSRARSHFPSRWTRTRESCSRGSCQARTAISYSSLSLQGAGQHRTIQSVLVHQGRLKAPAAEVGIADHKAVSKRDRAVVGSLCQMHKRSKTRHSRDREALNEIPIRLVQQSTEGDACHARRWIGHDHQLGGTCNQVLDRSDADLVQVLQTQHIRLPKLFWNESFGSLYVFAVLVKSRPDPSRPPAEMLVRPSQVILGNLDGSAGTRGIANGIDMQRALGAVVRVEDDSSLQVRGNFFRQP
eukprot:scaffold928_cov124-Pinguiococcus_pyrenoidosus.AAC.2